MTTTITNRFSFYRKGILSTIPDDSITIEDMYNLIKSDTFKSQCDAIRNVHADDEKILKQLRNQLKKNLSYVTPTGIFSARNNASLISFSNYAPIDIDMYRTNTLFESLKKDKYICLLFTSPSGEGLKAIIKIPNKEDYELYVYGFYKYLEDNYKIPVDKLDSKTRDISRACYLSYDTNAYLNPNSEIFAIKEIPKITAQKDTSRSAKEFSKILSLLYAGYSKDEIYNVLEEYPKWRDAPEQYREYSYNKALDYTQLNPPDANKKKQVGVLLSTELLENHHIITTNEQIVQMYIYKDGIYIPNAQNHIIEYVNQRMGKNYSKNVAQQVIDKIQASTFMEPDLFFREESPELIPVQNGILHLLKKELIPFSPQYKFFNKLPVKFDPAKTCEITKQHLSTILQPQDVVMMQELYGYLLYRNYTFERFWIFSGEGSNGKGKTLDQMKTLLGYNNCTALSLQTIEEDKFMLAGLFKKLANIGADIGMSEIKETRNIKQLTGRDLIECDQKFKSSIKFVNYAKQIFAANKIPVIADKSDGFSRRIIFVRFDIQFKTETEYKYLKENNLLQPHHRLMDVHMPEKLEQPDELSGVLNWALEGLERLLKNKDFSYTKSQEESRRLLNKYSSSIIRFYQECIERVDNKDLYETHEFLYNTYIKWCRKPEINLITEPEKEFIQRLEQFEQKRKVRTPVGYEVRWYFIKIKKGII